MICCKEWLVISVSLHKLKCQCTEIVHLSVAKKRSPKMVTSILNENRGLSLERIRHQIKICRDISESTSPYLP